MKFNYYTVVAWLISSALVEATCNHDNCYRALFPTASPTALTTASAFCTSLDLALDPSTVTGYPTRATSACGNTPSTYMSACTCLDKKSCQAANQPIRNGGFECGLALWRVNTTNRGSYSISAPSHTGKVSFAFATNQMTADFGPPSVQQTTAGLVLGQQYTLHFVTWFSDADAGFIGLVLNGIPRLTDDARDTTCWQVWKLRTYSFTADSKSLTVRFEFLASTGMHTFRLDDVYLS